MFFSSEESSKSKYSFIDLTLELIVHLDMGIFDQFFMIKTSFSKFSMPR
jgi:hypothetical protein